jgi:hypothetical protein
MSSCESWLFFFLSRTSNASSNLSLFFARHKTVNSHATKRAHAESLPSWSKPENKLSFEVGSRKENKGKRCSIVFVSTKSLLASLLFNRPKTDLFPPATGWAAHMYRTRVGRDYIAATTKASVANSRDTAQSSSTCSCLSLTARHLF